MPSRKRQFDCGHQGKGQFCHRCRRTERERAERDAEKQERRREREAVEREWGIALDGMPDNVVRKASETLSALRSGASIAQFDSQRMEFDRYRISIRLTLDYRLLLVEESGRIRARKVVPHEEYNAMIRHAAIKGW